MRQAFSGLLIQDSVLRLGRRYGVALTLEALLLVARAHGIDTSRDTLLAGLPLTDGASFFGGWVTVRPDSDEEACEAAFVAELKRLVDEPVP